MTLKINEIKKIKINKLSNILKDFDLRYNNVKCYF